VGSDFLSLSPYELTSAGQALFGASWRRDVARVLGVSEGEITRAELGLLTAPADWREKLIGLAQDSALRALETASNLLCPETQAPPSTPGVSQARRYA
jgi:hypothetical protein